MAKPSYSRADIAEKIESGNVFITGRALGDAYNDFHWEEEDILEAISRLKPNDCYKTEECENCPGAMMDFYRVDDLMDEKDVYTHFFIDPNTERLVINSFKERYDGYVL